MIKDAEISADGLYRYRLTRYWGLGPMLPFIMLNPSRADANYDDPTIRRCIGFAQRDGFGGIVVGNLYAFRATKPGALHLAEDPFGPKNRDALAKIADESYANKVPIVCGWGDWGRKHIQHVNMVRLLLRSRYGTLKCLGKTASGEPRHPLYVLGTQPLEPWP